MCVLASGCFVKTTIQAIAISFSLDFRMKLSKPAGLQTLSNSQPGLDDTILVISVLRTGRVECFFLCFWYTLALSAALNEVQCQGVFTPL